MVALTLAAGDTGAGREAGRRDHRRPLPAGHPDVPELGQEAARRAGVLLPAAHRGQHGVDRALHQLRAAAVQARRRSCVAADQHSRARRADQEHREPELGRHPDHEAARGLVLLRQPARCPPGRGRGVPARAPPRHLPLPGHQARERRREDPHQDAVARRGDPGHHLRAGQEATRTCTCSRRTTSSGSTACRSPTSRSPRSTTRWSTTRASARPRSRRASSSRRSPSCSSSPATRTSCSRTR